MSVQIIPVLVRITQAEILYCFVRKASVFQISVRMFSPFRFKKMVKINRCCFVSFQDLIPFFLLF